MQILDSIHKFLKALTRLIFEVVSVLTVFPVKNLASFLNLSKFFLFEEMSGDCESSVAFKLLLYHYFNATWNYFFSLYLKMFTHATGVFKNTCIKAVAETSFSSPFPLRLKKKIRIFLLVGMKPSNKFSWFQNFQWQVLMVSKFSVTGPTNYSFVIWVCLMKCYDN